MSRDTGVNATRDKETARTEMIERLGRVIEPDSYAATDGMAVFRRIHAEAIARQVLKAMMTPTDEMIERSVPEPVGLYDESWTDADKLAMRNATLVDRMVLESQWKKLINAALGDFPA